MRCTLNPLQKTILRRLLLSKADKKQNSETLIEQFLEDNIELFNKQLLQFLGDLTYFAIEEAQGLSNEDLIKLCNARVETFGFSFDFNALFSIYSKAKEEVTIKKAALLYPFGAGDSESIAALTKQFFWFENDVSKTTQDKIKNVLQETFTAGLSVQEAGDRLREAFGALCEQSEAQFKTAAHTLVRQVKNIAHANRYIEDDVPAVEVVAQMDGLTSPICRSLNGRIIPMSHIKRQVGKLIGAGSIREKIRASDLSRSTSIYGALPDNIGLPPYHFNCRTIVIPYYGDEYVESLPTQKGDKIVEEERTLTGSYKRGDKFQSIDANAKAEEKKVLFSHVDNSGVERVVTDKTYDHSIRQKSPEGNTLSSLNSIEKMGDGIDKFGAETGRAVALCQNNNVLVFNGKEVWTTMRFNNHRLAEDYFLRRTAPSSREAIISTRKVIKWLSNQWEYISDAISLLWKKTPTAKR